MLNFDKIARYIYIIIPPLLFKTILVPHIFESLIKGSKVMAGHDSFPQGAQNASSKQDHTTEGRRQHD